MKMKCYFCSEEESLLYHVPVGDTELTICQPCAAQIKQMDGEKWDG